MHFKTLSVNSMAGFPKAGKTLKSAMTTKNLPVPFPCFRAAINNEGPGRNKIQRQITMLARQAGKA
jgi:hypothetical protein